MTYAKMNNIPLDCTGIDDYFGACSTAYRRVDRELTLAKNLPKHDPTFEMTSLLLPVLPFVQLNWVGGVTTETGDRLPTSRRGRRHRASYPVGGAPCMVAHVRICTAIRVNIPSHFCVETSYSLYACSSVVVLMTSPFRRFLKAVRRSP